MCMFLCDATIHLHVLVFLHPALPPPMQRASCEVDFVSLFQFGGLFYDPCYKFVVKRKLKVRCRVMQLDSGFIIAYLGRFYFIT